MLYCMLIQFNGVQLMQITYLGNSSSLSQSLEIPLFHEAVSAGFPSPAQDYIEQELDLNQLCIQRPAATFFVRVSGESMVDAGIHDGDILVVDRSIQEAHGDIVVASLDGDLTVKLLEVQPLPRLVPCNSQYSPIEVSESSELTVLGVVTHAVRNVRGSRRS